MRSVALLLALLAGMGAASTASATPSFRDAVVSGDAARSLAAAAEWGGATIASNGESVTIYFSDSYPVDPARALQWADFMTSLVHGAELATVAIHLAPQSEVQRLCGGSALACYYPIRSTIYAPGEDPSASVYAKGILAHEYGHHIANTRTNPPFQSVDYGTKRWASYENVCSQTQAGFLYPGAEDARHYSLNPGEAFAETYRVLNEQKLGLPQESWNIVTSSLYPDASALSLLEQDVVTPWLQNTSQSMTMKLNTKKRTRTVSLTTPYDGTLMVAPRQSGRATKVSVVLVGTEETISTSSFASAKGRSLSTTVCGERSYSVRVKLAGKITKTTKATVSLSVSTP